MLEPFGQLLTCGIAHTVLTEVKLSQGRVWIYLRHGLAEELDRKMLQAVQRQVETGQCLVRRQSECNLMHALVGQAIAADVEILKHLVALDELPEVFRALRTNHVSVRCVAIADVQ